MQASGKLGQTPEEVAEFLRTHAEGTLDRTMIGEFLGERAELNLAVMHAYVPRGLGLGFRVRV